MQARPAIGPAVMWCTRSKSSVASFAIGVVLAWQLASSSCGPEKNAALASVSSTLYARSDTNATTVWSPRQRLAGKLGDSAGAEAALAIDSWTGASIDI